MYICVCIYVCMYIYIYVYKDIYRYICVCIQWPSFRSPHLGTRILGSPQLRQAASQKAQEPPSQTGSVIAPPRCGWSITPGAIHYGGFQRCAVAGCRRHASSALKVVDLPSEVEGLHGTWCCQHRAGVTLQASSFSSVQKGAGQWQPCVWRTAARTIGAQGRLDLAS